MLRATRRCNNSGKKLQATVADLRDRYPNADISVWAEDEHRIGMHPVNRRVWALRGTTPVTAVNWKFAWSWLAGFVEPNSGDTYWWMVPRVNWQIFERLLADFAEHFKLGANKRVLLVINQATFHTTARITVPEGLHLLFLPPSRPSCNRLSDFGRLLTKRLPTAASSPWTA